MPLREGSLGRFWKLRPSRMRPPPPEAGHDGAPLQAALALTALRSVQAGCGLLLRRPGMMERRYNRLWLSNPVSLRERGSPPALKRFGPTPAGGGGAETEREGFEPSVAF